MGVGRVRPVVSALAAYRPGKGAKQAEAEHGISDAIKIASNENPYAPPASVQKAIQAAAAGVNRYSDHGAAELRAKLAAWLDVDQDCVAVGCGSSGLLQQVCVAYIEPGDEVVTPWRSFEAYPIFVALTNGELVTVPLAEDHSIDLDAVAAAVGPRTKAVMLATPNNPTGLALSTAQIAEFMVKVPDDVLVVVDEAYREFSDPALGDPVKDLVGRFPNVVVTRTFSKAYGLAGLRSGYAVADPSVIEQLDKVLLAFSVNILAQAGAIAALDALDEIQVLVDSLLAERARVVDSLRASGVDFPDPQGNFVWLPIGDRTDEVALALEQRGVVVRPFSGEGIRVTISTPAENDRFLTTYAEVT